MNILSNGHHIAFLLRSFFVADKYAAPIDAARERGDSEEEKRLIAEVEKVWSDMIIDKFNLGINIINRDNLPKNGPAVFISNHQSYADILAIFHLAPFQLSFISKQETKKIPKLGKWILRSRGVFIERGDSRASLRTINRGVEYLKQGFSLCIFPEGTRSRGPKMGEFKAGSFKLAAKAGVPIVPITIDGAYKFFEENDRPVKGTSFDVTVHPAIDCSLLSREELKELPSRVEEIIRSALKTDSI